MKRNSHIIAYRNNQTPFGEAFQKTVRNTGLLCTSYKVGEVTRIIFFHRALITSGKHIISWFIQSDLLDDNV